MDTNPRRFLALAAAATLLLTVISPVSAAADPGWVHWVGLPLPQDESWVRNFAFEGTTIYAGSEGNGVFQSKDNGVTWAEWSTGLPTGTAVRQILATPTEMRIATDHGLFMAHVSATGAALSDWLPLGQGEGPDKINGDAQTLLDVSPTDTLAGIVGGLKKSLDGGDTWFDSETGIPLGSTVWSLDSFPALPNYILAATSAGAYESVNGGVSWSPVTDGLPTGTSVLKIVVDPFTPTTWFAITSGDGIYRSITGGDTWEPINNDIGNLNMRSVALLKLSATKVAIAVGTADGVYMSNDDGDHWQHLSNNGLLGHTSVWGVTPVSAVNLTLLAGAQGYGVNRRVMSPPSNTVKPTIADQTPTVGALETGTTGTWIGTDDISYYYQWQACVTTAVGTCTDIPNAIEATYTPQASDETHYLRLVVHAENAVTLPDALPVADSLVTTSPVAANASTLPGANQLPNPGFSGNPLNVNVGQTLTAAPGTWNPLPTSFLFEWFRCDDASGTVCSVVKAFASATTYVVQKADADKYIGVVAKGTNLHGSATSEMGLTSSPIVPLQVTSTTPPSITGGPWVGRKLTGATGSFSGPTQFLWTTWERCDTAAGAGCVTADGANDPTYTPNATELGKYLRLKVEADVNGQLAVPATLVVHSAVVGPITAAPNPPGAPTAVIGTPGNTQVVVKWTAPASNGGSPITAYTVTSTPGTKLCATTGLLTCTVTGLTNGTAYTFKVTATNLLGTGAASAASAAVTPRTLPGAPTTVTGVPANTQVTVSWHAPASNGGAAITKYTVTSTPGSKTCTTAGTLSCAVTGLTNGTPYTFKVVATNAAGAGPASAASAAVTPRTVPGAPTTVTAVPGNTNAVVKWLAPASNGGAAITKYTVTSAPGSKTCTTAGALTCTVATLTNGTPYTFTVTATNGAGTGAASAASVAVTPRTLPGAPTGVVAVPAAGQAAVSWLAPASNGGAPITKYTVTSAPGAKTCTTAGTLTCTVTGLTNNTPYTFTVTATNVAGTGVPSAASIAVKPGAVPGAPTTVAAVAGNASALVSWHAPASAGTSAISKYTVTSAPGAKTCTTAGALSCTVSGLTNGTPYTFTVTATNLTGTSASSAASAAVTPKTKPGAPTAVTALAGSLKATVSWAAPASNGGAAITKYTVTSTPGSKTCTTAGTLSCAVTGLTNGTPYTFKVVATNVVGDGPASVASAAVVGTTGSVAVVLGSGAMGAPVGAPIPVAVSWSTAMAAGTIASYTLQTQVSGGSWTAITLGSPTATSAKVLATRGAKVAYRVSFTTTGGAKGPWLTATTVTPTSVQDGAAAVTYVGTWTTSTTSTAYGGTLRFTSTAGRTATTKAQAWSIGWVSTRGSDRGQAEVWVDGLKAATVNLYAASTAARAVVWSKSFTTLGTHTVMIKVLGTHAAGSSGNRVDLDGFVMLAP